MGRLKWLPSFAVVFWEDEPPEERETEERCDSWRRAPSNSVDVCRGTVKIRYVRYVSDRRCIQVFFHRHVRVYPPPTPFRFSRRNQEIPPPLPDLHIDNSKDTQAASPPHLRKFNDYLCKSWIYKRRVSGASGRCARQEKRRL